MWKQSKMLYSVLVCSWGIKLTTIANSITHKEWIHYLHNMSVTCSTLFKRDNQRLSITLWKTSYHASDDLSVHHLKEPWLECLDMMLLAWTSTFLIEHWTAILKLATTEPIDSFRLIENILSEVLASRYVQEKRRAQRIVKEIKDETKERERSLRGLLVSATLNDCGCGQVWEWWGGRYNVCKEKTRDVYRNQCSAFQWWAILISCPKKNRSSACIARVEI